MRFVIFSYGLLPGLCRWYVSRAAIVQYVATVTGPGQCRLERIIFAAPRK